jgi:hypothetical protein
MASLSFLVSGNVDPQNLKYSTRTIHRFDRTYFAESQLIVLRRPGRNLAWNRLFPISLYQSRGAFDLNGSLNQLQAGRVDSFNQNVAQKRPPNRGIPEFSSNARCYRSKGANARPFLKKNRQSSFRDSATIDFDQARHGPTRTRTTFQVATAGLGS